MFDVKPLGKFADRLKRERSSRNIVLVRATEDATGLRVWYYVMVDEGKRKEFDEKEGTSHQLLSDYGKILLGGRGNNPPPDAVKKMLDEYGYREG